jgi:hypothetical protein
MSAARFEVITRVGVKKSKAGSKRPHAILLGELALAIDTLIQAYPGTVLRDVMLRRVPGSRC